LWYLIWIHKLFLLLFVIWRIPESKCTPEDEACGRKFEGGLPAGWVGCCEGLECCSNQPEESDTEELIGTCRDWNAIQINLQPNNSTDDWTNIILFMNTRLLWWNVLHWQTRSKKNLCVKQCVSCGRKLNVGW